MADELRQFKFRRGTSAAWSAAGTVLAAGEPGYDTTLKRAKIGDGATGWAALPWTTMAESDIVRLETAVTTLADAVSPSDALMVAVANDPDAMFGEFIGEKIADAVSDATGLDDLAEGAVQAKVSGLSLPETIVFGLDVNKARTPGTSPKLWIGEGNPVNASTQYHDMVIQEPVVALAPDHSYIGAGLVLATAGSPPAAAWNDSRGTAHLTQSDTALQPSLVTVNSIPVMRNRGGAYADTPKGTGFDAAALGASFRAKSAVSVMMLVKKTGAQNTTSRTLFWVSTAASNGNPRLRILHTSAQKIQLIVRPNDVDQVAITGTPTVPDGAYMVVTAVLNAAGGIARLRVNGVEANGSFPGAATPDTQPARTTLGAISRASLQSVDQAFGGDYAEAHIWHSALSGADLTNWEARMAARKTALEATS